MTAFDIIFHAFEKTVPLELQTITKLQNSVFPLSFSTGHVYCISMTSQSVYKRGAPGFIANFLKHNGSLLSPG